MVYTQVASVVIILIICMFHSLTDCTDRPAGCKKMHAHGEKQWCVKENVYLCIFNVSALYHAKCRRGAALHLAARRMGGAVSYEYVIIT